MEGGYRFDQWMLVGSAKVIKTPVLAKFRYDHVFMCFKKYWPLYISPPPIRPLPPRVPHLWHAN